MSRRRLNNIVLAGLSRLGEVRATITDVPQAAIQPQWVLSKSSACDDVIAHS